MHNNNPTLIRRKTVGIGIITLIALIHLFPTRNLFTGDWKILYSSYASDLIIPFGIYFLLCIAELNWPVFKKWHHKALFIAGFTTVVELLQGRGIYALGSTFDPWDLVMYYTSTGLAVMADRWVFKRYISYWDGNIDEAT